MILYILAEDMPSAAKILLSQKSTSSGESTQNLESDRNGRTNSDPSLSGYLRTEAELRVDQVYFFPSSLAALSFM